MSYKHFPGHKGSERSIIEIFNLIPKHSLYLELFAGSAAIAKRLTEFNTHMILNDIDPIVTSDLLTYFTGSTVILNTDAINLIDCILYSSSDISSTANTDASILSITDVINFTTRGDVFIYLDPPYPRNSRRSTTDIYRNEMSDADHVKLLSSLLVLKYNVLISTYPNEIYSSMLSDWNKKEFKVNVHGNIATEVLYFNYPKPDILQSYKYLGSDCWDRQRINRKVQRHIQKLLSLPSGERNKIISEIYKTFPPFHP